MDSEHTHEFRQDPEHLSSPLTASPPIQYLLGEEAVTMDTESSNFVKLANFMYSQFEDSKGVEDDFHEPSPGPGQEDFMP